MDAVDRHLADLATIKEGDKCKCCPECGSVEFKQAFDGERECKSCRQSWYADISYRAAPFEKLAKEIVEKLRDPGEWGPNSGFAMNDQIAVAWLADFLASQK